MSLLETASQLILRVRVATYYRCDGIVTNAPAIRCSTGWLQVDEPVYTLISQTNAEHLFLALLGLWAVFFVVRAIVRAINEIF